jgi:tetratricopeptide (TPR) repeat protein
MHGMKKASCFLSMLLSSVALQTWAASGEDKAGEPEHRIIRKIPDSSITIAAREQVDKAIEPFGQDDSPATREKIAGALLEIGRRITIQEIDDSNTRALAFYDEVDRRFRADKLPAVRRMVAEMLVLKGICTREGQFWGVEKHRHRKRAREESVSVFEEFEWRFGKDDDPAIRALYVKSLVEKGISWKENDDRMAAIASYNEAVQRFGEDKSPVVRAQVIYALLQKASTVKDSPFLDILDEIDRRFGKDNAPEVQAMIVEMLFTKIRLVGQPKKDGSESERGVIANATYDEIDRRFGKNDPAVRRRAANRLIASGLYEQAIQRFGQDKDPGVQSNVAYALLLRGERLEGEGDLKAALALYDEIDQRFRKKRGFSRALDKKGRILQRQGNLAAALAVYEDIGRRATESDDVALSLVRKGEILKEQGKFQEAVAIFDEIERRYSKDQVVNGRGYVAEAIRLRAAIRERLSGQ